MTIDERNKKVEENLKLVSHSLALLKVPWNEDYFQQGVLELIRCVENFDENKGYKFSTYAVKCITLKLQDYIKRDFVLKPKLVDGKKGRVYAPPVSSLNEIVHELPDKRPIMLQDVIPDKLDWTSIDMKLDMKIELKGIIEDELVSMEDLELFIDTNVNCYSLRDLSKKYNLSIKAIKEKNLKVKEILQDNISYNYYEGG